MSDERRLMVTGMPLEDAISTCYDLRRDGTLQQFVEQKEKEHQHKCLCVGKCERCVCKN